VISGRYDEATPALQKELVSGVKDVEQVILEESSHMPFREERAAYMAVVGDSCASMTDPPGYPPGDVQKIEPSADVRKRSINLAVR
jgi:hypothetical protein